MWISVYVMLPKNPIFNNLVQNDVSNFWYTEVLVHWRTWIVIMHLSTVPEKCDCSTLWNKELIHLTDLLKVGCTSKIDYLSGASLHRFSWKRGCVTLSRVTICWRGGRVVPVIFGRFAHWCCCILCNSLLLQRTVSVWHINPHLPAGL